MKIFLTISTEKQSDFLTSNSFQFSKTKVYIYIYIYIHNNTGPNLDLLCVQQSHAAPFCENYAKLYFNAKHLEKGSNRGQ